jgi:hypothetical protein
MKVSKPRVNIEVDSTFANLAWSQVQGAHYYTVKYAIADDKNSIINKLNVTSCSAVLTSLLSNTSYTVFVSTSILTHTSQETILNFKTLSTVLMENLGSGNELFPTNLTENIYNLDTTTSGYRFDPNNAALIVGSKPFQFCTFDLGLIKNKSHLNLQLTGASGTWTVSKRNKNNFADTLVFIKIENHTGWMDANTLRIPGVKDLFDGARVFDRNLDDLNSFRVTLASIHNSSEEYEGVCLIRIGLTNTQQHICGVKLLS